MSAQDNLSGSQFGDVSFEYNSENGLHGVDAIHRPSQKNLGFIEWHPKSGEIQHLRVNPENRRQGLATQLWHESHRIANERGIVVPQHSSERTPLGDAWAKSLGDKLPRKKSVKYQARQRGDE